MASVNIKFPNSPFIEQTTGRPSREWIQWLQNPQFVSTSVEYEIINGGAINNTLIGNVIPQTGRFTTLTALDGIGGGTF
jgi:hypothetical protein